MLKLILYLRSKIIQIFPCVQNMYIQNKQKDTTDGRGQQPSGGSPEGGKLVQGARQSQALPNAETIKTVIKVPVGSEEAGILALNPQLVEFKLGAGTDGSQVAQPFELVDQPANQNMFEAITGESLKKEAAQSNNRVRESLYLNIEEEEAKSPIEDTLLNYNQNERTNLAPTVTGIEIQTNQGQPRLQVPRRVSNQYLADMSTRRARSDVMTQAHVGTDPLPSEEKEMTDSQVDPQEINKIEFQNKPQNNITCREKQSTKTLKTMQQQPFSSRPILTKKQSDLYNQQIAQRDGSHGRRAQFNALGASTNSAKGRFDSDKQVHIPLIQGKQFSGMDGQTFNSFANRKQHERKFELDGLERRSRKESQSLALNLQNLRQQNLSARRTITVPTQDNYMLLSPKGQLAVTSPQGMAGFQLQGMSALSGAKMKVPEGLSTKFEQKQGRTSKGNQEQGTKDSKKSEFPDQQQWIKREEQKASYTAAARRVQAGLQIQTRGQKNVSKDGQRRVPDKEESQSNQIVTSLLPFHVDDTGSPVSILIDKQASPVSGDGGQKRSKDNTLTQVLQPKGLTSTVLLGRPNTQGGPVTGRIQSLQTGSKEQGTSSVFDKQRGTGPNKSAIAPPDSEKAGNIQQANKILRNRQMYQKAKQQKINDLTSLMNEKEQNDLTSSPKSSKKDHLKQIQKDKASAGKYTDKQGRNQTTDVASTELGNAKHSYIAGTLQGTVDLQGSQQDPKEQCPSSRYEITQAKRVVQPFRRDLKALQQLCAINSTHRNYRNQNNLLSGRDFEQVGVLSNFEGVTSPQLDNSRISKKKNRSPHKSSLFSPRNTVKSRRQDNKLKRGSGPAFEHIDGAIIGDNMTQKASRYKSNHGGPKQAATLPKVFRKHIIEQKVYNEEFDQGAEALEKDKLSTLLLGARSPDELQRRLLQKPSTDLIMHSGDADSTREGAVQEFSQGQSVRVRKRLATQEQSKIQSYQAQAAQKEYVPDRSKNLSSQEDHSREFPQERKDPRHLSKQATEYGQFHIADLLNREANEPGAHLGRVVSSVRTLDRILSERDIRDVISATGSYEKAQEEMDMIGDYTKNPFYMLGADEEFIIDHYRLIKRKKPDIAAFAADTTDIGEVDPLSPQDGPQLPSEALDDVILKYNSDSQARLSLSCCQPLWKSGIRVTNSIIHPIRPDGQNTDNLHWEHVARLPLGALNQDVFIRTLDGRQDTARGQVPSQGQLISSSEVTMSPRSGRITQNNSKAGMKPESASKDKTTYDQGSVVRELASNRNQAEFEQKCLSFWFAQKSDPKKAGKSSYSQRSLRDQTLGDPDAMKSSARFPDVDGASEPGSQSSASLLKDHPYDHLRARKVFHLQARAFENEMRGAEEVRDVHKRLTRMVDLNKTFLTALDRKKGMAELLPFELFIEDYVEETTWIAEQIRDRKQKGIKPMVAKSAFYHLDGRVDQMMVNVVEYDQGLKRFFVEYEVPEGSPKRKAAGSNVVRKQSGRLNLVFSEFDTDRRQRQRYQSAQSRRKAALMLLAEERIILKELCHRFPTMSMPVAVKSRISKLVGAQLHSRGSADFAVQSLIMQVEGLFVYAVLKSVIHSQSKDPAIRHLMTKYGLKTTQPPAVDDDGTIFKKYEMLPQSTERREDWENSLELLLSQTVPGNRRLMEVMRYAMGRTHAVVRAYPLFELPTELDDETLGYLLSQKEFSANTKKSLRAKLARYPVQMSYIQQISESLTERFKNLLRSKWVEKIAQRVEAVIEQEFYGGRTGQEEERRQARMAGTLIRSVSQINPYLMRFFTLMNIYLERMLLDKMKESMEKYRRFVLQFMARQDSFTSKPDFATVGLGGVEFQAQEAPMTEIKVQISRRKVDGAGKPRTAAKLKKQATEMLPGERPGYELVTVPDIEKAWTRLTGLIEDFRLALTGVKRIERIIYPLLEDTPEHLGNPDPATVDDLKVLDMQVQWLVSQARAAPEALLKRLARYVRYASLSYDQLIYEMKARVVQDTEGRRADEAGGLESAALHTPESHPCSDGEGLSPQERFAEKVAQVEIPEEGYLEKFKELDQAYWDVQLKFDNQYDFGIIFLDLAPAKKQICTKIQGLSQKLAAEVTGSFLRRVADLHAKTEAIRDKISASQTTVDEVIQQIEYIKALARDDHVLDDLEAQFEALRSDKDFVDSCGLKLPTEDFMKYLSLYLFPQDLKDLLHERVESVADEKKRLGALLQADVDAVTARIVDAQVTVEEFKGRGLPTRADLEREAAKPNATKEAIKALKEAKRGMPPQLNKDLILRNDQAIHGVEADLEDIEDLISTLNKRQRQLGLLQTTFPALDAVRKDLAPLRQLWDVSAQYATQRGAWWTGKINTINSERMQESVGTWGKVLGQLKKVTDAHPEGGAGALRSVVAGEVDSIRQYLPIIASLRTRGLEKRHFQEMSRKLGINIDPAQLTLKELQTHNLAQGRALEAIKGVSEVASKENSIKMAIDGLEKEMREIAFTCVPYKDTRIQIIKAPEAVLQRFEDCLVKIQSLKGNPFAKPQAERIAKNERELRFLQGNFEGWEKIQKAWTYLEPIYTQEDVTCHLGAQKKAFDEFDVLFKKIMAVGGPQQTTVAEFCRNEAFTLMVADLLQDIEYLEKSLSDYLDQKRSEFARLYFTSNEELMGLMGNLSNPTHLQVFLGKLFEGVAGLSFDAGDIVGFLSAAEEELLLQRPISTVVPPEMWLKEVEIGMKWTLYVLVEEALQDYAAKVPEGKLGDWILKWPSQVVVLVIQIQHNYSMERCFIKREDYQQQDDAEVTLESIHAEVTQHIGEATDLVRGELEGNARTSLYNFIVSRIQTRDSLSAMLQERDQLSQEDFLWKIQVKYHYLLHEPRPPPGPAPSGKRGTSQISKDKEEQKRLKALGMPEAWNPNKAALRHEWLSPQDAKKKPVAELSISCMMARVSFGYEYIGNEQRLISTPLTDRCLRTVFMALHFGSGASMEGPAGTGKTETTKEIARSLGRMCFVFNCASSFNFESLLKFFKGIASGGSWSCFDEFNRVGAEVLCVISQTMMAINQALREQRTEILLGDDGKILPFNDGCAIFLTINPFTSLGEMGVRGRSPLPENLKSQFRPVQMTTPDAVVIAEVILYCQGFTDSAQLSRKIVKTFKLADLLLSRRPHYDFGLRSVRTVLRQAALLLQLVAGTHRPHRGSPQRATRDMEAHLKALEEGQKNTRAALIRESALNVLKAKEDPQQEAEGVPNLPGHAAGQSDTGAGQATKVASSRVPPDDEAPLANVGVPLDGTEARPGREANDQQRSEEARQRSVRLEKWLGMAEEDLGDEDHALEELIVLRAMFDQNLAKLEGRDKAIFKNIATGMFRTVNTDKAENGSVEEELLDMARKQGLQQEAGFLSSVQHLQELLGSHCGVMVIGEPMAGKTRAIKLIESTMNRRWREEFKERSAEFLSRKAEIFESTGEAGAGSQASLQEESHEEEPQGPGVVLTEAETQMITRACRHKATFTQVINPRAQPIQGLMGTVDVETREFREGILTAALRTAIKLGETRATWIVLDGDVEVEWVENLNSLLDDNRKLTLVTGESLPLTQYTRVIIESDELSRCSPATVSRCGIIYMDDRLVSEKAVFNHYMRNLPPILSDLAPHFDELVNYFFPDLLHQFLRDLRPGDSTAADLMESTSMIYPVTGKYAVQNFLNLFEACVSDFRHLKFGDWRLIQRCQGQNRPPEDNVDGSRSEAGLPQKSGAPGPSQAKRKLSFLKFAEHEGRMYNALKYRELWMESFFIQSLVLAFASLFEEGPRERLLDHIKGKILSAQSYSDPSDNQPIHLPADPGSATNKPSQTALSPQQSIEPKTPEIKIIDQQMAGVKAEGHSSVFDRSPDKEAGRPALSASKRSWSSLSSKILTEAKFRELISAGVTYVPTERLSPPSRTSARLNGGKVAVPAPVEGISLRTSLPLGQDTDLLGLYFDIDTNRWEQIDSALGASALNVDSPDSARSASGTDRSNRSERRADLFSNFIHTGQTARLGLFLEGLLLHQTNVALVGESGSGKTSVMSQVVYKQMKRFLGTLVVQPLVLFHDSSVGGVLRSLESPLERKRKGALAPPYGKKVIYVVDDLAMGNLEGPASDPRGRVLSRPALHPSIQELLRQHLDHKQWYDLQTLEKRVVEDVSFAACVTCRAGNLGSSGKLLHQRIRRHWTLLGIPLEGRHLATIFEQLVCGIVAEWPKFYRNKFSDKLVACTLDLWGRCGNLTQPTSKEFLYTFNVRQLFRILHSLACYNPGSISDFDLCKFWAAEAYRTLGDCLEDKEARKIMYKELQAIATQHFALLEQQKMPTRVGRPFFCHFSGPSVDELSFSEVEKLDTLKPTLEVFITEFNETNKATHLSIPMFSYMVEQTVKVNRAIQQPFSNVILVGVEGLGKLALSRLALHVCRFSRHELSSAHEFDEEDWKQMLKKMVVSAAAEGAVNVLNLQDNQISDEVVLLDLNCLLKNGQLPELLLVHEQNALIQRMLQGQTPRRDDGEPQREDVSAKTQQHYSGFTGRVRRNMKAILNLTPNGKILNVHLRKYTSLIDCSTLIWMDHWPEEGFQEMGRGILEPAGPRKPSGSSHERSIGQQEEVVRQALKMHIDIQKGAQEYSKETGRHLSLTPCTFTALIKTFKHLFKQRVAHYDTLRVKYSAGLDQLRDIEGLVFDIQERMQLKSPALVDKQRQIEDVLRELDATTGEMEQRVKFVEEEEMALEATKTNAHKIRDECERQFGEAIPGLKQAINGLKKLSKAEITELKTIKRPSQAVYTLLQCVCIIMDVPPRRIKKPDASGEYEEDWWAAATSSQVLNNFQLVEILSNYNPERLNKEIMLKLDKAAANEVLKLPQIKKACTAAQGIFHWLMAMQNYYFVYTECKPKRDALFLAEKQILVHESEIEERKGQLGKLQVKLEELRDTYKEKEVSVRRLQGEIDECNIQKTRAAKLLNSLQGEKQKWSVLNRVVQEKYDTLEGDCLLAAGLIVYLGQLAHNYREDYFFKWLDDIREHTSLRISEYFDFVKLFGDRATIKNWISNRLPNDSCSISNALMIELSPIQSIIVDPLYQASSWLKANKGDDDDTGLEVLARSNPRFVQLLSASIKYGNRVLIENVGEEIDRALYPLFNKSMLRVEGEAQSMFLQGVLVPIDPTFRLYVTTELENPRFLPEVAVFANFIYFAVTQEGLEAQLLSVIVSERMAKAEKKFAQLKIKALDCIQRLQQVEVLILEALDKDLDVVLNDDKLIEYLSQSSLSTKRVTKALQQIKKQESELLDDRKRFLPVARRGAMLFFLVRDLTKVEPIYQFSLKWFMRLFEQELRSKDNINSMLDPLVDLNNRLTRSVYQKLCAGVLQRDRLMIAFMIAYKLMKQETKFDEQHLQFIIKGPLTSDFVEDMAQAEKEELESKRRSKSPQQHPQKEKLMALWQEWMTERHWDGLEALSQMPPFDKPNVIDHMIVNHSEWDKFINGMDDHANPIVPGPYAQYSVDQGPVKSVKQLRQERLRREAEAMEALGHIDLDKIFSADDSDRSSSSDEGGGAGPGGRKARRVAESPTLDERSDEDEDMFLRRRNYIEEDEFVSKKVISGLPEYSEFEVGGVEEKIVEQEDGLQSRLTRDILRFCIIRIFRPDQIVEQIKRLIEIFLDGTYTGSGALNYGEVVRSTDNQTANLLLLGPDVDAFQELTRMSKALRKDCQLHYWLLNNGNLHEMPIAVASAAQAGHWLLLDDVSQVTESLPEIEAFLSQFFSHQQVQDQAQDQALNGEKEAVREVVESENERPEAQPVADTPPSGRGAPAQIRVPTSQAKNTKSLVLPPVKDFAVSPAFRLWIAAPASGDLSLSFLQNCNKVILEPVEGVRLQATKALNSTPKDYLGACPEISTPLRLCYFALTFFHAVAHQRNNYGSLGWNRPYEFTTVDHHESCLAILSVLKGLKGNVQRLPEALGQMRYIVGELVYGGKITDAQDQMVARDLMEAMFQPSAIEGSAVFNLTGAKNARGVFNYCMPLAGTIESYLAHVSKFPTIDPPEVFGIHANASFSFANKEGECLLASILDFEFAGPNGALKGALIDHDLAPDGNHPRGRRLKSKLQEIEAKLPELIPEQSLQALALRSDVVGIASLVHQEAQKYNTLTRLLGGSVRSLLSLMRGESIPDLEAGRELEDVACDRTPLRWLTHSYPASRTLSSFLRNLIQRVGYSKSLVKHLLSSVDAPAIERFWLPGFFSPASLFAVVLQQGAQRMQLPLEKTTFRFSVTSMLDESSDSPRRSQEYPRSSSGTASDLASGQAACLIGGLTLVAATWNRRMRFMEDLPEGRAGMAQPLPLLLVEVVPLAESHLYEVPCDGIRGTKRQFSPTEDPVRHGFETFDKKGVKYYMTPLYTTSERGWLQHSAVPPLIRHIPLRLEKGAKSSPFWVRRGTALVCQYER